VGCAGGESGVGDEYECYMVISILNISIYNCGSYRPNGAVIGDA
jgi:hypothetical protein